MPPTFQGGHLGQASGYPFFLGEPVAGIPLLKYTANIDPVHLFELGSLFQGKTSQNLALVSVDFERHQQPATYEQGLTLQQPICLSRASCCRAEIPPYWIQLWEWAFQNPCVIQSPLWSRSQHAHEGSS